MNASAEDITIHYQLTEKEAVSQFVRLTLLPIIKIFMVAIAVAALVVLAMDRGKSIVGWGMLLLPILFHFIYHRTIRKFIREHPEFLEEQTLGFNTEGLSIANSVATIRWPWERVAGLIENDHFYIVRFDKYGSGAIIPKRALGEAHSASFLSFIKKNRKQNKEHG